MKKLKNIFKKKPVENPLWVKRIGKNKCRHYCMEYMKRDLGELTAEEIDNGIEEVFLIANYIYNTDPQMKTLDGEARSLDWAFYSLVRSYDSYRWALNHDDTIKKAKSFCTS